MRRSVYAGLIGLSTVLAMPAFADEIKVPSDPVAKAAFDALEKACSRCHQDGKLVGRERPSKNFGNILKLDEIAANPNLVLPGNPYGSKLFKQIVDKEMPYDVMYEGATTASPSAADLKALETWIQALGQKSAAACEAHKLVGNKEMVGLIAADLNALQPVRAKSTRYLTLTHLANICTDAETMKVYRQGAIKLVNSLSRSSDVVRLETIDPEGTIIRINLDDLGWKASDWETVLGVYPYGMLPDGTNLTAILEAATGTKLSYVRADWFAFTASRPPLYDKLLGLPKTFQALAKDLGVDVEADIKSNQVQRAGFAISGVSQNNRLIERHRSTGGYFWTSYDFAGTGGKKSLFEHPTGPKGDNAFEHDGGETIYSLPNGFQAYYLNKADGEQIAKGPTNIVRDPTKRDLAVTNGISCMGCHDQGMRKAKDDIRDLVLKGTIFPKDVRDAVDALYPPHDRMDQVIEADAKRFASALASAGVDPNLKLNGVEMINALSDRFEANVDLAYAAAELGLRRADFEKVASDANKKSKLIIRRLAQGSVPREEYEARFAELVAEITDDKVVKIAPPDGKATEIVRPTTQAVDALTLVSDKSVYKINEVPVFTVVTPKDCYLTLSNVDEKGAGETLFPNRFQTDNHIKGKVEFKMPVPEKFSFQLNRRGIETVIAVCRDQPGEVDGIKHNFTRSINTPIDSYTDGVTRSIQQRKITVVEANKNKQGLPKPATEVTRDTTRSAITVEVR